MPSPHNFGRYTLRLNWDVVGKDRRWWTATHALRSEPVRQERNLDRGEVPGPGIPSRSQYNPPIQEVFLACFRSGDEMLPGLNWHDGQPIKGIQATSAIKQRNDGKR